MSDAYGLIEVNSDRQGRLKEINFFDLRFACNDFDEDFICDEVIGWIQNKTKELPKDQLIAFAVTYKSIESFNGESTEYEDSFILDSFYVVKENYKEFYRHQVTLELETRDMEPIDKDYYKNLVADWEEFYDEDFKPWVKPTPLLPNGKIDLMGVIKG